MNIKTTTAEFLNFRISALTAFKDSAELRAALERGYIPTIRPDAYKSAADRGEVEDLRTYIIAAGFKVHPMPAPHTKDADCAPYLRAGECRRCGVSHVESCSVCSGRGYHVDGCSEIG